MRIKYYLRNVQSSSGYSLIELVVVLILIGLFTAIASPFIISTLTKTKLKTTAKEIATTLRYARSQAIPSKKPYYFYIDLDNPSFWISPETVETDRQGFINYEDAYKAAGKIRPISDEIIIEKVEAGLSVASDGIMIIPFYPQGNTVSSNVYLHKRNDSSSEKYLEIQLDEITGKVRIVGR